MRTKSHKRTRLPPPEAGQAIWNFFFKAGSGESDKGSSEFLFIRPPFSQLEPGYPAARGQLRRNQEKLSPDSSSHLLLISQSCLLEPVHQVVGQHDQLEVKPCPCPCPAFRNALVQAESIDTLLDEVLAAGTLVVKTTEDHLLEPYLLGYHHIEFDLPPHQPVQEIKAEESAISTKSCDGYLSRQLVQHGCQEILCLISTGTVARSEHVSEIIPGLSDEAHQRMVAGTSAFLRIVPPPCPVLSAKDRDDMGVEIKGDCFQLPESFADQTQQLEHRFSQQV